jgi:hypothetical protein
VGGQSEFLPAPSRPSDLISGRGGEIDGKGGVVAPAVQSSFSGAPIVQLTSTSLRMNVIALGSVCKAVDHLKKVSKFFWRLGLSWCWQMTSSHFTLSNSAKSGGRRDCVLDAQDALFVRDMWIR